MSERLRGRAEEIYEVLIQDIQYRGPVFETEISRIRRWQLDRDNTLLQELQLIIIIVTTTTTTNRNWVVTRRL